MFTPNDFDSPYASSDYADPYTTVQNLENFVKATERDFFAHTTVRGLYYDVTKKTDLILNMRCNFSMEDAVSCLKNGEWDTHTSSRKGSRASSTFYRAFQKLRKQNSNPVDIAELSIQFEETSIVVARTDDGSIAKHLSSLLKQVHRHFIYYTKGISEIPHEIFIPVFETSEDGFFKPQEHKNCYFKHWGVYLENDKGQEETMLYNLKTKKMYNEDFYLV